MKKMICIAIFAATCTSALAQDAVKHKDTSTGSSSAKNINTSEDNLGSGKGNITAHGSTGATTAMSKDDTGLGGRGSVSNGSGGIVASGSTGATNPSGANGVKAPSEHASALANGR